MERRGGGSSGGTDSPTFTYWMKIGRDTLGVSGPSPRPDCTVQGSSARKLHIHYFWLLKPVRVGVVEETAKFSLLKGPIWL